MRTTAESFVPRAAFLREILGPSFDLDSDVLLSEDLEGPSPVDAAFHLGFTLGSQGIPAACSCDATTGESLSFRDGLLAGIAARWERLAAREADLLLAAPGDDWPEAERVAVLGARAYAAEG